MNTNTETAQGIIRTGDTIHQGRLTYTVSEVRGDLVLVGCVGVTFRAHKLVRAGSASSFAWTPID